MSQIETRQFQVEADSKFPFAPSKTPKGAPSSKGPKGSIWGLAHLNWLHLKFSCGYNWEELFPSENGLNQSSAVVSKLKEELGKEWPWICNNEHHSLSIYAIFKRLAYQRREDDEYKTDTYASSDLSPAPTLRQSSSPPQMRQSGMSRQGMCILESHLLSPSASGGAIITPEVTSAFVTSSRVIFCVKTPAEKNHTNCKNLLRSRDNTDPTSHGSLHFTVHFRAF